MLSAGPLDTTFGSGGTVTTLIGSGSYAFATALQSDGKILAAGQANYSTGNKFALSRYTTSGSLDPNFGSGGEVTTKIGTGTSFGARAIVLQSDGKIVLAGSANSSKTGGDFALARYNANGSLDTSFGNKGIVSTALSSALDVAFAVAIQPDGKIIAAGSSGQFTFALARYNANGSLDTSFGSGGTVLTAFGTGSNPFAGIDGMTLQSDGKLVVAGYVGPAGVNSKQFTVARYNVNGTLDTSFGAAHTGIVSLPPDTAGDGANSVVIQADGKIVAAGYVSPRYAEWAIARFSSDGSLDSAFGSGGVVTQDATGGYSDSLEAFAVTLQSDSKIVVAGTDGGSFGVGTIEVGRYNADGTLDTSFNGTGLVSTPIGSGCDAFGVVIQPADGKIVIAGEASVNGVRQFAVARYVATDPFIGSFTASVNPVTAGSSTNLTVSNITDSNPNSSITQLAFYLDSNGDGKLEPGSDMLLGYATQTSPGVWTFTCTVSLAPGSYTLFAQAEDNYSLFSDPFALTLTVQ
jgi:uncharacterized delta-60 repeat protein